MNTEVKIPTLPESIDTGVITNIYVDDGQFVYIDDALFDVETDKVVLEIVAPANGIVELFQVSLGDNVTSEQVAMHIREPSESEVSAAPRFDQPEEIFVEKIAKDDTQKKHLEQVVGRSLFDKRGAICGVLGFILGVAVGVLSASILMS